MEHLALFATFIVLIREGVSLELGLFESAVIPSEILVSVGESVYIRVKNPVESHTSCSYKAPGKKEINSYDPFVTFTDDECGIKIEKAQHSHVGPWKLTLNFKNATHEGSVHGISVVGVKEPVVASKVEDQVFASTDNFAPSGYNLNYCYVSKTTGSTKFSEIETSKCTIPQGLNDEFCDGTWNVRMGVEGVSREVPFSVNIQSTADETIDTVIKRDNDVVKLLCRLKNLKNILKFCRFERLGDDDFGLNLEDGIGIDNYRYYGQGLSYGECGLQINNLNAIDKTQWKCYVGLMDAADAMTTKIAEENKKIYKYSSVLDASDDWNKLKIISDNSEIYLVDNQSAVIQCNANNPFDYCWMQNPAKKMISLSDKKDLSDEEYQYHGDGFHLGHCGVKIKLFHFADAGEWKCGVGRVSEAMKEAVKSIKVEVKSSSMMAVSRQIEDFSGNSVAIQCRAIPIGTSLSSCHFLMPNGEAFSINEKVTKDDSIDGLFYFDPNRKLSDGYCTVVIKQLNENAHTGKWICGGKILGQYEESYDEVNVIVDRLRGASFSYITLAIVLPLVVVLALSVFGYKKYKQRRQLRRFPDNISLNTLASNVSNNSNSSGSSDTQITAAPIRSISHSC